MSSVGHTYAGDQHLPDKWEYEIQKCRLLWLFLFVCLGERLWGGVSFLPLDDGYMESNSIYHLCLKKSVGRSKEIQKRGSGGLENKTI